MRNALVLTAVVGVVLMLPGNGFTHCEIPCGIYGDPMRFEMIQEHLRTIEKSMKQIEELGSAREVNHNQLSRWVRNKEEHAVKIQHIVAQYFMTQRLKPVEESDRRAHRGYVRKLTLLHRLLVEAMKCKQTTEPEHVEKARALLRDFHKVYFPEGTGSGRRR